MIIGLEAWHIKNKSKCPKWCTENKAKKAEEITASGSDEKSKELQLMNVSWKEKVFNEAKDEAMLCHENASIKAESMLKMISKENEETGLHLLDDPEIFVIDTSATTHSTGYGIGLIRWQRMLH